MRKIREILSFYRIAGMICMLVFFSCLADTAVQASENKSAASDAAVVSSRTADQNIYIYIRGADDIISGTTIQIGNTLCEDIQVAAVASMGIPVRTTILFDNSKSLSQSWGSQSKELIRELIDGHGEGEEIRLATFAHELSVVADFSTDYEALKAAVDGISFVDQESYLTDTLYDILLQDKDSGEANYTRIVIIADGADDKEIKYTQAELSDLMKSSGVVIHTAGVKTAKNSALLETLFSYSRLTGGVYKIAEKDTDVKNIKDAFNEDWSLLCIKLKPAMEVMDGGRKEAKLNLNTSGGAVVLRTSLQMPFADVGSVTAAPSAPPTPVPAADKSELPSIVVQEEPKETSQGGGMPFLIPMIAAGVAVFVIIVILVILLVLKGKKQKQIVVSASEDKVQPGGQVTVREEQGISGYQGQQPYAGGNTVMLNKRPAANASQTLFLQSGAGEAAAIQTYLTLTDVHNPQRRFRVRIDARIVIGREEGDILLGDDKAVSYTHCEILRKGKLFYVNDLKSSNGTFYGGMRVQKETPVMDGGILKAGTHEYKITIENP